MQYKSCKVYLSPGYVKLFMEDKGREISVPIRFKGGQLQGFIGSGEGNDLVYVPAYPGVDSPYGAFVNYKAGVVYEISEVSVDVEKVLSEKSDLKAYETPTVFDKHIEYMVQTIRRAVLSILRHRSAELYEEVQKVSLREFFPYLRGHWEKIEPYLKGILSGVPKLVVFDPQAGSGESLISAGKNYGVEVEIFGSELRNVSPKENYHAARGIDSNVFFEVLRQEFGVRGKHELDRAIIFSPNKVPAWFKEIAQRHNVKVSDLLRAMAGMFFYANPPYQAQGRSPTLEETLASIPFIYRTSNDTEYCMPALWLLSAHDTYKRLLHNYQEVLFTEELSHREVGYDYPVPERYIFTASGIQYHMTALKNTLDNPVKLLEFVDITNQCLPALAEVYEKLEEISKEYTQRLVSMPFGEIFHSISLERLARAGEKVFPDLTKVYTEYVSYDIAIANPILLSLYKERYPELYELIERIAKERKDTLPERVEDMYALVGEKGLGLLKHAGIRWTYGYEEGMKVLEGMLSGDELNKVKVIAEEIRKQGLVPEFWIKTGDGGAISSSGAVSFGEVSYIALADNRGQTHLLLPVSPTEFIYPLNERKFKSYEQEEGFREYLLSVIRGYVNAVKESDIFNAEDLLFLTERGVFSEGIGQEDLVRAVEDLYIKQKLEGRFIRDRVLKVDFFEEVEKELIGFLSSVSASKEDIKPYVELLRELKELYERDIVAFAKSIRDGEELVFGKTLLEYVIEKIEDVPALEESKGQIEQFFSTKLRLLAERVLYDEPLHVYKAVVERRVALTIERLLSQGREDLAIEFFKKHLELGLGLYPHQIEYALNAGYGLLQGRNALVGWAMRTGKTLAVLFGNLFYSFASGNKSYFFVRSANLIDIYLQLLSASPSLATKAMLFPSMGRLEEFGEEFAGEFLPLEDHMYPAFWSSAELFAKRGTGVSEVLKESPHEKIRAYAERPDEELLRYAKNKIYGELLKAKGFSKKYMTGLVCYLAELDRRGVLSKDNGVWLKWVSKALERGNALEEERAKRRDFSLGIASKEVYTLSIVSRIEEREKMLDKNVFANVDISLIETGYVDYGYYVLSDSLLRILGDKARDLELIPIGTLGGENIYLIKNEDTAEIRDFIDRMGYTVGTFYSHLTTGQWNSIRNRLLVDISSVKSGYLEFPMVMPVYVRSKEKIFAYEPDNTVGFEKTIVKLSGRDVVIRYQYDPEVNGRRIILTGQSNKSNIAIDPEGFLNTAVAFDEGDANLDSMTANVIQTLSQKGVPISLVSGTLDYVVHSLLASRLTRGEIERYLVVANRLTSLEEVKDVFDGFFEDMAKFVLERARSGGMEVLGELLHVLTRGSLEDRVNGLLSIYKETGYYTPDKERAFKTALSTARNIDKAIEQDELVNLSNRYINFLKFFKNLSERAKDLKDVSVSSLLALFRDTFSVSGFTSKASGVSSILVLAQLVPASRVDMTFGDANTLNGKPPKRLMEIVDDKKPSDLLKEYREKKHIENYQEPVGGVDVELEYSEKDLDLSGIENLREFWDSIDWSEVSKVRRAHEDVLKITQEFQALFEKEGIEWVFRSGKTTSDDLVGMVREFLERGRISVKDERKAEFAEEFIHALEEAHVEVYEDYTDKRKEKKQKFANVSIEVGGRFYSIELPLSELYGNPKSQITKALKNRYLLRMDLGEGREWSAELFQDGVASYEVLVSLIYNDYDSVIDGITNGDLYKVHKELANEDTSYGIFADRVHTLNVAIVDALNSLINRENKKEIVHFIVLETNDEIKDLLNRIDKAYLSKNGIKLYRTKDPSQITVLVNQLRNVGERVVVSANSEAVARGVDLSQLDLIVNYTFPSGSKSTLQLLARNSSPNKETPGQFYLGTKGNICYVIGEDYRTKTVVPNRNMYLEEKVEKLESAYRAGLSGEEEARITNFVPVSKIAKEVFQALASQEQEKMAVGL